MSASSSPTEAAPGTLSRARRRLFFVLALLVPVFVFGALEGVLRIAKYDGDLHVFRRLDLLGGRYYEINKRLAARYFADVRLLPTPTNDLLLVHKPRNGFRVFVLGASTTNGFPYGYNGTFSRVLQDALHDVLPGSTVEVVNLGIAALNTYYLYDEVGEILAQHPDAVLIYAGQNEYYGALGVASTERAVGSPGVVRTYLELQRLKIFLLARDLAVKIARALAGGASRDTAAGLMEFVVRDPDIPLGGRLYDRGVEQYRDNLRAILGRFHDAGVPVFIGSLTSNLRDQPPLRSTPTPGYPPADSVYVAAQAALRAGDTAQARTAFRLAKDLDGLRFRAPSAFNQIIRDEAREHGAHYVPVDEAFAAASPGGIPGKELFWEHLHPTQAGDLLMAKAFYEALKEAGFVGAVADTTRLRPWQAYYDRMELTEFDRRYAWHTIESLKSRWPFVARVDPAGYPHNYQPTDLADSAAFAAVNYGVGWPQAKTALADQYRRRGQIQLALAEYRGLIREQPINTRFLGIAAELYLQVKDTARATDALAQSLGVQPSGLTSYLLGTLELGTKQYEPAATHLEQALEFSPDNPPVLFDLSRALAMVGDSQRARYFADRLLMVQPGYAGLSEWRAKLEGGVRARTSSRSR